MNKTKSQLPLPTLLQQLSDINQRMEINEYLFDTITAARRLLLLEHDEIVKAIKAMDHPPRPAA
jgi:hypothetical protein